MGLLYGFVEQYRLHIEEIYWNGSGCAQKLSCYNQWPPVWFSKRKEILG